MKKEESIHTGSVKRITTRKNLEEWIYSLPRVTTEKEVRNLIEEIRTSDYTYSFAVWLPGKEILLL